MEKPKFVTKECKKHGETEFVLEGRNYYRCKKCRSDNVAVARKRRREELIKEFGGKCAICSYDKYVGALCFHHVDPADKEYALSAGGLYRRKEDHREEARKCVILCANCHAEVHAGITQLP